MGAIVEELFPQMNEKKTHGFELERKEAVHEKEQNTSFY